MDECTHGIDVLQYHTCAAVGMQVEDAKASTLLK